MNILNQKVPWNIEYNRNHIFRHLLVVVVMVGVSGVVANMLDCNITVSKFKLVVLL